MFKVSKPTIPKQLQDLHDARREFESSEALRELRVEKQDMTTLSITSPELSESVFSRVDFSESSLEKLTVKDVVFDNSSLVAANCNNSGWNYVSLTSSRCSGAQFYASSFKNCILKDTDFYSAELDSVYFENCTIESIEFSQAKLLKVDLSTSDLGVVNGTISLKGAIISSAQLFTLAPYFAQQVGVIVKE